MNLCPLPPLGAMSTCTFMTNASTDCKGWLETPVQSSLDPYKDCVPDPFGGGRLGFCLDSTNNNMYETRWTDPSCNYPYCSGPAVKHDPTSFGNNVCKKYNTYEEVEKME